MNDKNKRNFIKAINNNSQWRMFLKSDYEIDIVDRYLNGESFKSISNTYGVCSATIRNHILGSGKFYKGGIYKRITHYRNVNKN